MEDIIKTDIENISYDISPQDQIDMVESLKEMAVYFGGTENDIEVKPNGAIVIDNDDLINAMVTVFANHMRESGFTEEEVQEYIAEPWQDDGGEMLPNGIYMKAK